MSKIYEYTVVSRQLTTPTTLILQLHDIKQRQPLAYAAGQYAAISFMNHNRPTPARCFSITSTPTDQGLLEFGIRVKGNYTSTAAAALVPGSKVIVEGPFGNFIYSTERDRLSVMLAGGIGIAPFMSMLRYATRLQLNNDIILLYSCHSQDDIPFLQELVELNKANKHLYVVFVIGSGPVDRLQGLQVAKGRINQELLDYVTVQSYTQRTFFICGPPAFSTGMSTILEGRGVPPDDIITEGFTQGQRSPKELRHNLPLQVYALTGLSLIMGSATIMARDVAKVSPTYSSASYTAQNQTTGTSNSRQDAVNQTIAGLQSQGGSSTQTQSSQTQTQSQNQNQGQTKNQTSGGSSSKSSSGGSTTTSGSSGGSSSSSSSGSSGTSGGSTGSGSSGGSGGGSGTPSPSPSPSPSPKPSPSPSPSPTPPPPAPVAPSLSFGASAATITSGHSTTLSWGINGNATSPVNCSASGGWSGAKATGGSQSVSPSSTTTYNLVCSNSAGSSSKSVTVTVTPACVSTPSNPC